MTHRPIDIFAALPQKAPIMSITPKTILTN